MKAKNNVSILIKMNSNILAYKLYYFKLNKSIFGAPLDHRPGPNDPAAPPPPI
jgi:hypothetical protein